jgi:hypothetical protein
MRHLNEKVVKDVCLPADYRKGEKYFQQNKVTNSWQTEDSLHASVSGSGKRPYQVHITDRGQELKSKCTCPAYRRHPFCKHVAAVLIAWTRVPERFVMGQDIVLTEPQSRVRRARKTKVDRRQIQAEGLSKIEDLLVELASYGLLSLTSSQVARVNDLAHTAESHKLRRMARQVALLGKMLETALVSQNQTEPDKFDENAYAKLLSDAWLTVQATRRALEDPEADPTLLDELIGKTWRNKDLEKHEKARLLELAYETVESDIGFIIDTSYLICLNDGALYTEKQIVPKFKKKARKPSYTDLLSGTIGLYPGPEPRRVKLIQVNPSPINETDWQRSLTHAERSVEALFKHFQAVTANPLIPPAACTFFAPAQIFVDGNEIHLLDESERAISMVEGWRMTGYLMRYSIAGLFGRIVVSQGKLSLLPMGLVTEAPEIGLVRVTA